MNSTNTPNDSDSTNGGIDAVFNDPKQLHQLFMVILYKLNKQNPVMVTLKDFENLRADLEDSKNTPPGLYICKKEEGLYIQVLSGSKMHQRAIEQDIIDRSY